MIDVDITAPLSSVVLRPDETGAAVLLRKLDRPIGFFLAPLQAGTILTPAVLAKLITRHARHDILAANVHDELVGMQGPAFSIPDFDLTVAVCTRDRPELLETCLRSLLAVRNAANNADLRVLVVDNAPSDRRTFDVVAPLVGVQYVVEPKAGLDFARNRALAETTTTFLAFVDDDATVDRGWLAGLREAWHEQPDAAAVTGQVLPAELVTDAQLAFERAGGFRRGFQTLRFAGQARDENPLYPTGPGQFGAGCNMAFRTDALRRLGGFDPALDTGPPLPGGGDLDVFYRAIRSGRPLVYAPRALVFHRHRREHEALRHQYWTWGTGFMAFLHKSYRCDTAMRPRLRRMLVWWLIDQAKQIRSSTRPGNPVPFDVAVAQLAGALLTGAWLYPRSRRRTGRIQGRGA